VRRGDKSDGLPKKRNPRNPRNAVTGTKSIIASQRKVTHISSYVHDICFSQIYHFRPMTQPNPLKAKILDPLPTQPNPTHGQI